MTTKPIDALYPVPENKKNYCAIATFDSNVKSDVFSKLSQQSHSIGLTWLLSPEPLITSSIEIEDIIRSSEFENATDREQYLLSKVRMSEEEIKSLASQTIGQHLNSIWLIKRRYRITASNFGLILNAIERNRYPLSLFKKLVGTYKLDGIKAIQWGRENEKHGIEEFEQVTGKAVVVTGLWLHSSGVIGASPDGLVGQDTIIEVKCPYSYRNSLLIDVLKNNKSYIIYYDEGGLVRINKNHEYYSQMQGQLCILKRQICYLVIWTIKDLVIVEIPKDEQWVENIDKIKHFYFKEFIPYLLK